QSELQEAKFGLQRSLRGRDRCSSTAPTAQHGSRHSITCRFSVPTAMTVPLSLRGHGGSPGSVETSLADDIADAALIAAALWPAAGCGVTGFTPELDHSST